MLTPTLDPFSARWLQQRSLLSLTFLLLLVLTELRTAICQQVSCVQQINTCKCQTTSGKFIDLSPLAGTGDYRFKGVRGPGGNWVYSYNPCNGLRCDTSPNAASCQNDQAGSYTFQIGLQDTAEFRTTIGDGLHIRYTNGQSGGIIRESIVTLVCQPEGPDEFKPTDDGGVTNPYIFHSRLTSKYACEVGGGGGGGSDAGGMSGGDILIIVFFVLLVVYLAGGFAVNILLLKKAVGPEALPNVTFWISIPGYVKEGALFTVGKVREVTGRRKGYDSV